MENDERKSVQPEANENDWRAQYLSLRKQVFTILVLLIIVSGTFNIFLWRQYRYTHADLQALRKQAGPMIAQYQQQMAPRMDEFIRQIREYGRKHPGFAPILARYGLTNGATQAMPETPGTPHAGTIPGSKTLPGGGSMSPLKK